VTRCRDNLEPRDRLSVPESSDGDLVGHRGDRITADDPFDGAVRNAPAAHRLGVALEAACAFGRVVGDQRSIARSHRERRVGGRPESRREAGVIGVPVRDENGLEITERNVGALESFAEVAPGAVGRRPGVDNGAVVDEVRAVGPSGESPPISMRLTDSAVIVTDISLEAS